MGAYCNGEGREGRKEKENREGSEKTGWKKEGKGEERE